MSASKEEKAMEEKWRAEDDLRTLTNAAEIRKDKGRMKRVRAYCKEQIKALSKLGEGA